MALTAAHGYANARGPRGEDGLHLIQRLHGPQEREIDVPDGKGPVQHRRLQSFRPLTGGGLGRAGHDGKYADLLRFQAGPLHRLLTGQRGGQLHGQDERFDLLDEPGKPDPDAAAGWWGSEKR